MHNMVELDEYLRFAIDLAKEVSVDSCRFPNKGLLTSAYVACWK